MTASLKPSTLQLGVDQVGTKKFDPKVDFDLDGAVGEFDLGLLKANYLKFSPLIVE